MSASATLAQREAEVTTTILRAEAALKDAAALYDRLVRAEIAILACPDTSEQDVLAASMGLDNARRIRALLEGAMR